ncbi:hypothetical protein [Flindersiella endophytica]
MTESFAGTYYPRLREVLDPRFASLTDAELEAAFESAFGEGVTPAEYEELFGGLGNALSGVAKDVGKFAQQAAPFVATGAQGALRGASAGSALGPYGALIGGLTGATGAVLQRTGSGTARDVGNVLSGVVNTAGALTGRGVPGSAGGAAGPAAPPRLLAGQSTAPSGIANLLGFLQRQETPNAMQTLARGSNVPVPVGPQATPVPASAFANLLAALAQAAAAEAIDDEAAEAIPGYLLDSTGTPVVDPSDPEQRAARLLQLMSADADDPYGPYETDDFEAYYDEADELALYETPGW